MALDVNSGSLTSPETTVAHDLPEDPRARKRALGAYYTPDRLSAVVAAWAIKSPADRILEPGFGGCGFLLAAKLRLESLGQGNPHNFIHGCDVDAAAFDHLRNVFNAAPSADHFPCIDFMKTEPGKTWGGVRFSVALGNPPYVSYQAMGGKRSEYQVALSVSGWPSLSARASLWAYFVLHALSYLDDGGRVAWVLPGSLMRSDYSRYVKDIYTQHFAKVALFHVHERLFGSAGANEETVVLVAEGFRITSHRGVGSLLRLAEFTVETVEDLSTAMTKWASGCIDADQVEPTITDLVQEMTKLPTLRLGGLLSARIGLVTGDNAFFLFSEARAKKEGIDLNAMSAVFAKGSMARGLSFGKPEINSARAAGRACFLLSWNGVDKQPKAVIRYLDSYPKERITQVSTFKKRKLWHEIAQAEAPDAFWPVMRDLGPKLVLNPLKLQCTNTIHRIFFKDGVTSLQRKQIAICLQTSFAQLHAEECGRSYGSGVLKHEPRDVEKILIPWPQNPGKKHTNHTYTLLDAALRAGDSERVMEIADKYVGTYVKAAYSLKQRAIIRSKLISTRKARMPIGSRIFSASSKD